ncbi:ATP-binding protein [Thalassobaculum sp. OXR-137]|uniref:ATP-binding protein n=1 Tax=Thalassobaculum sp. OXR-137 TaxID=3100173 RepID=UPI002AC8C963|nr:ATP-binding protein [Thalassobaculum sp. OXR-137]WPZ33782.1 ATP-binding protein [Thalassobaculum sp. OXR-137]
MALSWLSVKPKHQVLIGAAIGLVALIGMVSWDHWHDYNQELDSIESRSRRTSQLLAQHTARVFEGIDSALRETVRIRQEARDGALTPLEIHRTLKAVHGGTPVLKTLGWVDREGNRLATSGSANPPPLNISKTPGFRAVRSLDGPSAESYVSEAFYSSTLQATVFFVGYRMTDKEGTFDGLIYGTVDPSYFRQLFKAADLGLSAVVTLSRSDGRILARYPFDGDPANLQVLEPALDIGVIDEIGSGYLRVEDAASDIDRLVGFAPTGDRRFVLSISVDHAPALAWFKAAFASDFWRLLLAVALLIGVAAALIVQIRQREAVAQRLRDSEGRFRDFAEASGDWFWETDAEHRMVWMSKAVEQASHASRQWHLGKRRIDMCARELMASPSAIQDHQRVLDQHLPFSDFEYPRRSPSGIRWIRTSGVPIFGTDGTFVGYRGTARDITDFIDAKERLRDATNAIPGGFMLFNDADELIYRNAPSQHPTGIGFVERIGDTFETMIRRVVGLGMIEEAQENPEAWIRWRLKRHADANATTLIHINGRAIEMVERKTSDGGRMLLRFDVTDREMAYEEIRRARDAANAANKAKSDFLASMSHELRTPLNAIIGFGEILQRGDLRSLSEKQVTEYSGYIVSSGQLLLSLVNDVLDLSTVEAGQMKVTPQTTHVAQMIERAVTSVRPLAEQREIDLQVEIDDAIGPVLADKQRSIQVLLNLLSNAIKYNTVGGIVRVHVEQDHNHITISVTDSGPGISALKAARLFSPFDRLGAEFGSIEGTGIGLALSKKLAMAMSGQIGYQPAQPNGSTFWLSLPRSREAAPREEIAPASGPEAEPEQAETVGGFTLLCIEDNPINARIVEHAVSSLPDVRFVEAATGLEGVDRATELRPDVIVLDLNLPDISGQEVHALLRANPETRDIPVIALTAAALTDAGAQGKGASFFRYLTKPMDFGIFLSAVQAAISQAAPGDETVEPDGPAGAPFADKLTTDRWIDPERLATLQSITPPEVFAPLLRSACSEIEQRTAEFGNTVIRLDTGELAREIHALRGLCLNIGAPKLAALAGQLEDLAWAGDRAPIEQAASEIKAYGGETVDALTRYLQRAPRTSVNAA